MQCLYILSCRLKGTFHNETEALNIIMEKQFESRCIHNMAWLGLGKHNSGAHQDRLEAVNHIPERKVSLPVPPFPHRASATLCGSPPVDMGEHSLPGGGLSTLFRERYSSGSLMQ